LLPSSYDRLCPPGNARIINRPVDVSLIHHGQIVALYTPLNWIHALSVENRVRFTLNHGFDPLLLQSISDVSRVAREGDKIVVWGGGPLMAHVAVAEECTTA
jgi:hypothetical protein